jgi:hypothetical protein
LGEVTGNRKSAHPSDCPVDRVPRRAIRPLRLDVRRVTMLEPSGTPPNRGTCDPSGRRLAAAKVTAPPPSSESRSPATTNTAAPPLWSLGTSRARSGAQTGLGKGDNRARGFGGGVQTLPSLRAVRRGFASWDFCPHARVIAVIGLWYRKLILAVLLRYLGPIKGAACS